MDRLTITPVSYRADEQQRKIADAIIESLELTNDDVLEIRISRDGIEVDCIVSRNPAVTETKRIGA